MATKRTCTNSHDWCEGHANLKTSKRGSGRETRDLFSPRRVVGRNDMVVDLNLGKVVIPKEEVVGFIKEEKISEELEDANDRISVVEDEEDDIPVVKVVGEEVDISDHFEADKVAALMTCSCACWNRIESLEAIVEEQGRQIQNLNNVVMGLLGKQVASEQVQRVPGKESVVIPVLGESQPTQSGEIDSGKETGKRPNPESESMVHQPQPHIPSSKTPVISGTHSKNERSVGSANLKMESSRPLPTHPNGTGNSRKTTKLKASGKGGATGEKHACPQCAKEGNHRLFSCLENLRRHVREKHSLQKQLHKCESCSKTFLRKELLDHHIRIVHEGVRYQCTHCTGSYAHRRFLVEHEKIHARGIRLIRCKLCGLDLISKESLRSHLATCVGAGKKEPRKKRPKTLKAPPPRKKGCVERPTRACTHCEKRFDCDASLRYHLHKRHGILQTGEINSFSEGDMDPLT